MLVLIVATAAIAGCSGSGASTSSSGSADRPSASQPATAAPAGTPAAPSVAPSKAAGFDVRYDGRIAVGGTRKLEVRCVGSGTPTILLEGGGITPSLNEYPRSFVNGLAGMTTVCHYSRAGGGGSSALPGPTTMAALVSDTDHMLAALKSEAGIEGPYLFVGWSFGGTVALAEALAHPDTTAGLVILDTDWASDFMPTCLAAGRTKADCQAEYDGDIEAKSIEHEFVGTVKPLPDLPIKIVNALVLGDCVDVPGKTVHANISGKDLDAPDCATLAKLIAAEGLRGWSTLGPQVTQTLVQATHDGLIEHAGPEVAAVILDALAEARATP